MEPEHVTFAYLHDQLSKIHGRIGRLEKVVIALVVVTASPKFGGPSAHEVVTALLSRAI